MLDYILDDIILSVSILYIIIVLVKSFEEFLITAKLLRVLLRMELKKRGKLDGRVITEFRNRRRSK
uniref:Uncharacterized protein n=1 Tax=Siphoviridae sp. ctsf32 TaxID=2827594 RepID=A0A8S5LND7_9CAUD|nr:MAG TPA: hypothetical protein [Siphoviridae sp. ctsf32]